MDAGSSFSNTHSANLPLRLRQRHRNWLITGATGFIGRELVNFLLSNSEDHLTLLVRTTPATGGAEQRVKDQQHSIDPTLVYNHSRVTVVECDFTKPKLGLVEPDLRTLQRYNNYFIHLAANTRFSETLDVARSVNVKGTQSAVEAACSLHRRGVLERFAYVSTAYVHGFRTGHVHVDDPLQPHSTRNTYERSMSEAELYVRSMNGELPTVIFRPSIVVGDSVTGRGSGSSSSSTMYWAIKQYLQGRKRFFGNSHARLDILPVDFVVSAMYRLVKQPDVNGRCFPLVAGFSGDVSVAQLSRNITRYFGLPAPVLMNPRLLELSGAMISHLSSLFGQRVLADNMLSYLPYFSSNPCFDNTATVEALSLVDQAGKPTPPEFESYCDVLFRHCLEMGWAKDQQKRKTGNGLRFGRAVG